ncbi:MAG TPA: pyrimidine dimer DNA glycosylase/endonuclease V [Cyclobacteriaceae bacterium]|nr:pyrimidine dimer DNA glycosylase/endonuclease V [Cyclobacteriaceae bacterium]
MRLRSIHPKYLDAKGLVALWRETLLAKHVLEGKTKGYRNHPQLDRFKLVNKPKEAINQYLVSVFEEAKARSYNFDKKKINWKFSSTTMSVTTGQMEYETSHLLKKLKIRDRSKFRELSEMKKIAPHPMFNVIKGKIEKWEIIQ